MLQIDALQGKSLNDMDLASRKAEEACMILTLFTNHLNFTMFLQNQCLVMIDHIAAFLNN